MLFRPLSIFLMLVSALGVLSQAPIPKSPDGVRVAGQAADNIQLEIFIDPLCPDSRAAWPVMKEVTQKYRGHASLLVHLFPLPYHQYSFAASQVAASLYKSPSFFSKWVETVYLHQEEFYNDHTLHLSRSEVDQKMSQLGPESGLATAVVLDALQTREYDMALRTSWKYGCSRGVTGTPIYIVNGVLTTPKANTIEAWADIIKPLLQ